MSDLNIQFHNGKWWTVACHSEYDSHTKRFNSKKKAIEYSEKLQNEEVLQSVSIFKRNGDFETQSSVVIIRPSNKERLNQ